MQYPKTAIQAGSRLPACADLKKRTVLNLYYAVLQGKGFRARDHFPYKTETKTGDRRTGGERFLLVDDNDMEGLLLQEALTKRGAECTVAKSGEQALKMFKRSKREKFQYILMDADMPDMDGYQAARRIRLMDHPQAKTIPILAMTYHATPEAMRMAAITGMSGQVEKPVKMQTLALIITKLKSKNRIHPGYDYDRK